MDRDKAEHLCNLERVMNGIQENGLHVCKEKCSSMQDSVEYPGHTVDNHGIQMSPKKVKAVAEMPRQNEKNRDCEHFYVCLTTMENSCPIYQTCVHHLIESS